MRELADEFQCPWCELIGMSIKTRGVIQEMRCLNIERCPFYTKLTEEELYEWYLGEQG